jgi:hypothetical protein
MEPPLDLRLDQRPQPSQVDQPLPVRRGGHRAPVEELRLAAVLDRPVRGLRAPGTAWPSILCEALLVAVAQAGICHRRVRAGLDLALAVAGERRLLAQPLLQCLVPRIARVTPAAVVGSAQRHAPEPGRPLWADHAARRGHARRRPGAGRGGEGSPAAARLPRLAPLQPMLLAEPVVVLFDPPAGLHDALPAVDRMLGRDRDQVAAVERVESRCRHQRRQQLQPVPPGSAGILVLQDLQHGHDSPQTRSSAAMNAGSCRSAWP